MLLIMLLTAVVYNKRANWCEQPHVPMWQAMGMGSQAKGGASDSTSYMHVPLSDDEV